MSETFDTETMYTVHWGSFDDHTTVFLIGPKMTEEQWQGFLATEVPKAAERALLEDDSYIGWGEVMDAFVKNLKEKGFHEPKGHTARFGGLPIFRRKYADREMTLLTGAIREKVLARNEAINEKHGR